VWSPIALFITGFVHCGQTTIPTSFLSPLFPKTFIISGECATVGGVGSLAGEGDEDEVEPEGEARLNGGFFSPALNRRLDIVVSDLISCTDRGIVRARLGSRVVGRSRVLFDPVPASLCATPDRKSSAQDIDTM
jgi:hypothetical protein